MDKTLTIRLILNKLTYLIPIFFSEFVLRIQKKIRKRERLLLFNIFFKKILSFRIDICRSHYKLAYYVLLNPSHSFGTKRFHGILSNDKMEISILRRKSIMDDYLVFVRILSIFSFLILPHSVIFELCWNFKQRQH